MDAQGHRLKKRAATAKRQVEPGKERSMSARTVRRLCRQILDPDVETPAKVPAAIVRAAKCRCPRCGTGRQRYFSEQVIDAQVWIRCRCGQLIQQLRGKDPRDVMPKLAFEAPPGWSALCESVYDAIPLKDPKRSFRVEVLAKIADATRISIAQYQSLVLLHRHYLGTDPPDLEG